MTHRIRPREEWLDPALPWDHAVNGKGQFYVCPPFRGWSEIDTIVIHYPGADWADMDIDNDGDIDPGDTVALLRAEHRMYLMGADRGYSLGYGFKVGLVGDVWEIRGWEYANAANLGDTAHGTYPPPWNNSTISIQVVVDGDDPANDAQVDAINWLLDRIVAEAGHHMALTYHGAGQATGCPGAGIKAQLAAGVIAIGRSHPDVIDPTPTEEDDMRSIITRWGDEPYDIEVSTPAPGSFARVWRGISPADAAALIAAGVAVDARSTPLPIGMKGGTGTVPPNQYRRVG